MYETTDPEYPLDGNHDSDNTTDGRPVCVAGARCILEVEPVGAEIPEAAAKRARVTTVPIVLLHTVVVYRQIG